MTSRPAASRLARLALVAALAGCASAVREPPPVAAIAHADGGATVLTAPRDVEALLADAAAGLAQRPDAGRVAQARELFLAAARADETRTEGLLGAARAGAWLIEHEADATRRATLAVEDVQLCQWCTRRAPADPECDYRLALAIGQQARERPATALDALSRMVELLRRVAAVSPSLDGAGPHRVLALVLLRAPGWPTGPGDPESGLAEAQRAVALAPDYPPNLLVLGEARAANGQDVAARAAWQEALELATAGGTSGDPDAPEWAAEAARFLSR